jgi:hypothetical protein
VSFEPRRLDAMPDHGHVTVGSPSQERLVRQSAAEHLTDYFLSSSVPPGNVYVMNMDQVFAQPDWSWK